MRYNFPISHTGFILLRKTQKNPARKAAFTGTFTSQRLERILEYFKLSSNIHWKYVDGKDASQKKTHIEIY